MVRNTIPKVESRISSWIEIQKNRKKEEMKGDEVKTTITVSREFGCEGYPLVAMLKERLDEKTGSSWTIFDNEFVDKIVADKEISKHLVKSLGDRAKYLDYIVSSLISNWKSEPEAFKLMAEAIYSVAQQGNAIILERGAFAVTKKLNNCFHFRLFATLDYRAESYSRRTGMPLEEARGFVEEKEKVRTDFLSDFLNCDFDPQSFHMVFNNGKLPIEKIADSILNVVNF